MSRARRHVFEFAVLTAKQLEQQKQQEEASAAAAGSEAGSGGDTDAAADYVMVDLDESSVVQRGGTGVSFGGMVPCPPPAAAAPMAPGGPAVFGGATHKQQVGRCCFTCSAEASL